MIGTCGEGGIACGDPRVGGLRTMNGRRCRAFHCLSPPALANEFAPRPGIKNAPALPGPFIVLAEREGLPAAIP